MNELRVKHLEMIQSVISRQNSNSFLVKGWTVTVAGIIYVYTAGNKTLSSATVGLVSTLAFWILDGQILHTERLFRTLYEDARRADTKVELFSMQLSSYGTNDSWLRTTFSATLLVFYTPILIIGLALLLTAL